MQQGDGVSNRIYKEAAMKRKIGGLAVLAGMLAATLLGVFLTPAFFVVVERWGRRRKGGAP